MERKRKLKDQNGGPSQKLTKYFFPQEKSQNEKVNPIAQRLLQFAYDCDKQLNDKTDNLSDEKYEEETNRVDSTNENFTVQKEARNDRSEFSENNKLFMPVRYLPSS